MSYKKKVIEKSKEIKKPGIYTIDVEHDDNCSIWKSGVCNCNAKVSKPFFNEGGV